MIIAPALYRLLGPFFLLIYLSILHAQTDEILDRLVAQNPVFEQGYSGFCLYDPVGKEFLYEYRADQRFTPASNIKLLTFLLVEELLDMDRVPALWFKDFGSRVEVWGTGLPLEMVTKIPFPEAKGKPMIIHQAPSLARYGPGWSYDDYEYGYVFERSSLPAYGNRLSISVDSIGALVYEPGFLADSVQLIGEEEGPLISREEWTNHFELDTTSGFTSDFELGVSLRLDDATVRALYKSAWHSDIELGQQPIPVSNSALPLLRAALPDSILTHTLQESDNFWAEQLLLLCASERQSNLDVETLLEYATDTLWADWQTPIEMDWVDGSGLSRYNQLSPRHLIRVLERLQEKLGLDDLKSYLPANGISGTLEDRFITGRPPYIWAKTGSLRHVLALSGIVKTKSGRHLLFSFMHNNRQVGSRIYYREMEKVFTYLYNKY
ncbi:MAG: D-alanyl-D-alanine carboxypeptidase [Bacteroidota bacterium]